MSSLCVRYVLAMSSLCLFLSAGCVAFLAFLVSTDIVDEFGEGPAVVLGERWDASIGVLGRIDGLVDMQRSLGPRSRMPEFPSTQTNI